LTTGQRATAALDLLDYEKEEARKRQGRRTDLEQTSVPDGTEVTDEPRSSQRAAEEAAAV